MPKLQYRFNSTTKDIELYDTKPNDKNIAVKIDGKTYYAGLLPVGHSRASNLRIYRDGEAYAIAGSSDKLSLEDYTWAQIATIIQAGEAADYFAVGDTKPITLSSAILDSGDDVAGTYRVRILGIDHNAEIEGTNRVHFAIGRDADNTKDICFYGHKMNATITNVGGWEASAMRSWLNDTFYNVLPSDLQAVITACTKYTDNVGGGSGNVEANVTATSDKIWLPAEYELYGVRKCTNEYEQNKQAKYPYWNPAEVIGNDTSKPDNWGAARWSRSPYPASATQFVLTSSTPTRSSEPFSFVPCFTIS